MGRKTKEEWQKIHAEYRAGQLSVREIARQHIISHEAIRLRIQKEGWEQDLKEQVDRQIKEKLASPSCQKLAKKQAQQIIEEKSDRPVIVVECHRADIQKWREINATLLEELQKALELNADLLQSSVIARNLAQGMARVIPLERQAFSIPDVPQKIESSVEHRYTDYPPEVENLAEWEAQCAKAKEERQKRKEALQMIQGGKI